MIVCPGDERLMVARKKVMKICCRRGLKVVCSDNSVTADHAASIYLLSQINPLKPELNPTCYLLALLGAHHFLHVSRIRVK